MSAAFPGTDGYADEAPALFERYESLPFDQVHTPVLDLIPTAPCRVLEIGAGTGRDAAHLAALGHRVVAVEPTLPMLAFAKTRHGSRSIVWLHDGLPELARVRDRGEAYDMIMLTAVWMHLDAAERRRAMAQTAPLLAPRGRMFMMLRYGPVPAGRRMFQIPADETPRLAEQEDLILIHDSWHDSIREPNRSLGVRWNRLAFERP